MPVRLGMLSAAHVHAPSYAACSKAIEDSEFVGVWDDDPARGQRFASEHGVPFFANRDELLDAVDAVIVTSENTKHADNVEAAAAKGKHVICEKPLAVTPEQAERILGACDRAGVILMTAFPCPFTPSFRSLADKVRNGAIGKVLAIAATNHGRCPFGWFVQKEHSGGGAMIDHVVHVADILRRLLGEEPVRVQAQAGHNTYAQEWEDVAMLTLEYPSGVFATLDASWSRPSAFRTWGDVTMKVVGEKGVIEVDMFGQGINVTSARDGSFSLSPYGSNADLLMLKEFVRAVLAHDRPEVTGQDGWAAARVAVAGYESLKTGQPVAL